MMAKINIYPNNFKARESHTQNKNYQPKITTNNKNVRNLLILKNCSKTWVPKEKYYDA